MSHLWVQNALTAGSVDSAGAIAPGGCRSQDSVATQIQAVLKADATLALLFEDRIYRFDSLPQQFYGEMPCVLVSAQSASPNLAPTRIKTGTVDTSIIVVHTAAEFKPLEPWEPSVSSALEHIEAVLANNCDLTVDLQSGASDFPIARNFEVVDRTNIFSGQVGDSVVVYREIIARHEIKANHSTGQIEGIV